MSSPACAATRITADPQEAQLALTALSTRSSVVNGALRMVPTT